MSKERHGLSILADMPETFEKRRKEEKTIDALKKIRKVG